MLEEDMENHNTSSEDLTQQTQDPTQVTQQTQDPTQVTQQTTHTDTTKQIASFSRAKRFRKSSTRSMVWDHFIKNVKKDGLVVGKCKYCEKEIRVDPKTNGTSGLRNHMKACKKHPCSVGEQTELNFKVDDENNKLASGSVWKFDQEAIRKALIEMVIINELPFKFVETKGFKRLFSIACPRFRMPSRWTASRDCLQLYLNEKLKLKKYFEKSKIRVSLTTDTWTCLQKSNYMSLTAHYIDEDWKLQKKLLNFCQVHDHTGRGIDIAIEMCLLDWGIDKVFFVTVDNASSNNVAINYLREKIVNWGFSIAHGKYMHMRCIAHIVNLIVHDGLKEIGSSVHKIRQAVRYIRWSPSRLSKFKESIEIEKIQSKSLLCLDVSTRWNSTYLMLDAAQKFEKAFERYKVLDPNFCYELAMDGGTDGVPSHGDWENARRTIHFLENFYALTVKASGSLYVTSTILFDELNLIDQLLNQMADSGDFELTLMAYSMREKYNKYWGDTLKTNKLVYIAAIFDPRLRFKYVEGELCTLYEKERGLGVAKDVKIALFEMFDDYRRLNTSHKGAQSNENAQFQTTIANETNENENFREAQIRKRKERMKRCRSKFEGVDAKTELDKYICEDSKADSEDFDILSWWKVNSPRFPVLLQMARDVLAVPISTVASESAFSTGGRVLDPFRSCLSPKIVQALLCTRDWLKDSSSDIVDIQETMEYIDKFENEFTTLAPDRQTPVNI